MMVEIRDSFDYNPANIHVKTDGNAFREFASLRSNKKHNNWGFFSQTVSVIKKCLGKPILSLPSLGRSNLGYFMPVLLLKENAGCLTGAFCLMDYIEKVLERLKEWARRLIETLLGPEAQPEPEPTPIPVNEP